MFRLITISSSSKSNAWAVDYDGSVLLFDCGVALRTLKASLEKCALSLENIKAVFITHSHSDHTKGMAALSKKIDCPFYSAVEIDGCIKISEPVSVSGMTVSYFLCSHDVPCVGYKISNKLASLCIATDTGVITNDVKNALYGCDTVVLESNHDVDMLRCGPYPAALKTRILSEHGHLSNQDCANCLLELSQSGKLKCAVLAHLSETNNTPLFARATTLGAFKKYGINEIEVITANAGLEVIMED